MVTGSKRTRRRKLFGKCQCSCWLCSPWDRVVKFRRKRDEVSR